MVAGKHVLESLYLLVAQVDEIYWLLLLCNHPFPICYFFPLGFGCLGVYLQKVGV
jgi:hypothetical protein